MRSNGKVLVRDARSLSVFGAGLVVVLGGMVEGASAQEPATVPPVFVPFREAAGTLNVLGAPFPLFGDSVRGFFDAATFVVPAPGLREQYDSFQDEARAAVDQVPIPSGSVSVFWRLDPALDTYVKEERPLAPAISLNARTNGRGVITFGAGYSYLDYDSFEGFDQDEVGFATLLGFGEDGRPVVDAGLLQFRLRQNIFNVSIEGGVLENLDVGILIPVIEESVHFRQVERFFLVNPDGSFDAAAISLDENGQAVVQEDPTGARNQRQLRLSSFNVTPGSAPRVGLSDSRDESGIGDVILRSKVFFGSARAADFGGVLNLSVPTGDEDNLLGVGSVRLDPRLLVSTSSRRFAAHVNLGFHADFDEEDRDRFDYSAGGEVLVFPWMSILVDQVGRLEVFGSNKVQRFDIVPGIKLNPYKTLVVGFNAIVPLNDDGLRTDYTPNALLEISTAL